MPCVTDRAPSSSSDRNAAQAGVRGRPALVTMPSLRVIIGRMRRRTESPATPKIGSVNSGSAVMPRPAITRLPVVARCAHSNSCFTVRPAWRKAASVMRRTLLAGDMATNGCSRNTDHGTGPPFASGSSERQTRQKSSVSSGRYESFGMGSGLIVSPKSAAPSITEAITGADRQSRISTSIHGKFCRNRAIARGRMIAAIDGKAAMAIRPRCPSMN